MSQPVLIANVSTLIFVNQRFDLFVSRTQLVAVIEHEHGYHVASFDLKGRAVAEFDENTYPVRSAEDAVHMASTMCLQTRKWNYVSVPSLVIRDRAGSEVMSGNRITFFWNPNKVGFYGHDDNGVKWSTTGPGNRPVQLTQYQRCGICGKPIHSGYRSEHGALVCPEHVDMVKVSGYELRAYHLKDGRRETWTYPDFYHARKGYLRQVALAEEAAAQLTFSLMVIHEDRGETCLLVY